MSAQELLQKRAALIAKQEEMLKTAHKENRNLTVDEYEVFNRIDTDIADTERMIETDKKVQNKINALDGTYNQADFNTPLRDAADNVSLGEICQAAISIAKPSAVRNAADVMSRVTSVRNAPSGGSANVPIDGGFLIGATRSNEIMKKIYEADEVIRRCTPFEVGEFSDSFEIPYLEETSRAAGSRFGGLRAYREGEVDTPTASQPAMGLWECRLSDMKALVYLTERMMQDAPAIESLVMELMPDEFQFKLGDEIFNGTGGIQCTGIIGNNATVSITKETGQAADTILFENIVKMYSRCWGRSRTRSAWYYNQDIEPQLFAMSLNVGTAGVPVFMPANGLSGAPYMTLFGRPMIPVEHAKTLGDAGDIILADFSEYALVRKGGLKSASSIHVKFLTDEVALKFNMRVNGKPKWKGKLTPASGSGNTLSPFVTVAAR